MYQLYAFSHGFGGRFPLCATLGPLFWRLRALNRPPWPLLCLGWRPLPCLGSSRQASADVTRLPAAHLLEMGNEHDQFGPLGSSNPWRIRRAWSQSRHGPS